MTEEPRAILIPETGEIIDPNQPAPLEMLDVYSPHPVADEAPRLDALATVSAGYKEAGRDGHAGRPVVSRDGKIYLHDPGGQAPALQRALETTEYKRLTIAFPFNNPSAFVQQRFTQYSTTKLLIYGDAYGITQIHDDGTRHYYPEDDEHYDVLRRQCKVNISIYFALAHWEPDGSPVMDWDDGLALYRIRTTSRNTIRSLNQAIEHVRAFTHGQIAGIPFDVALDYRDVSRSNGERSNVPVWTFRPNPPGGLSSRTFAPTLVRALREGRQLQIAPPRAEDEDVAEADFYEIPDDEEVAVPSDEEAALIARGGKCDARVWEATWFTTVKESLLDTDEARAAFLLNYTNDGTDSLSFFLSMATESDAAALIAEANQVIADDAERAMQEKVRDAIAATGKTAWSLTQLDDEPVVKDTQPSLLATETEERGGMPNELDREAYKRGLTLAGALQIDTASYEMTGEETRNELIVKSKSLEAKITEKQRQMTGRQ